MPIVNIPQTNFTRGELDPKLYARADIKAYANGAGQCRNVAIFPQGGARRRPGSRWCYDMATADVQLAEFVFGEGQEYLFAFLDAALKVFDMEGALLATVGSCPWTAAILPTLYWTSAGDTTIATHPDIAPQKILRTGAASFTVGALDFETTAAGIKRCPYFKHADDSVTLAPSATTGNITLTTSAAHWVAGHVGLKVRYKGKQCTITSITSSTVANATANETLAGTTADVDWDEEAFGPAFGYPIAAGFHDQRLCFIGHKSAPDAFWASKPGAYFNFDTGTGADGDGIAVTIGSERANTVRGFVSSRHPQIFTDSGPFYIPTSESRPLTPTNVAFRRQAPFGCAQLRPRELDGATLFVQKKANVVRELLWSDTEAAYTANSVSLLSGHLIRKPLNMAVLFAGSEIDAATGEGQQDQYAFVLNTDGTLAVYQSVREEQVAGWALWSTAGKIKAICAVDTELFWIAERTINGQTVWWLEKLDWDPDWTLDAAKRLTAGEATTEWAGFDHLAGETVHVLSGRVYLGLATVDAEGRILLDDPVSELIAGLDFTPLIRSLPPIADLADGPISGRLKHIVKARVQVKDTLSLSAGGQRLLIRKVDDDLSQEPTPLTGWAEFYFDGWSEDPTFDIEQTEPLPMTVLGYSMEVES